MTVNRVRNISYEFGKKNLSFNGHYCKLIKQPDFYLLYFLAFHCILSFYLSELFLCNAHERMWIDVLWGTCVITETSFVRNNLNISLFCLKTVYRVDFEKLTWFRKWCFSLSKIGSFLTISMFTQIILGICFKNKRCCFIFFSRENPE